MNGALGSSLLLTTTGSCTTTVAGMRDAAATAASSCQAHPMTSNWTRRTATGTRRNWGWNWRARRSGRTLVTAQLQLKPPPYPLDALEPHMSKETLEYHWRRHHRHHVDRLNALIAGTELDDTELEDIILASYNRGNPQPAFIDAAQIWNHDFFWESMKPGGGGKPSGRLMELIERDFGSFDKMLQEFTVAASTQFGSGWVWLAYKANRLEVANGTNPCPSDKDKRLVIHKTPNAVNPLVWDYSPLLAIDVWEHAYYLDYESRRADYVSIFLEKLVSWEVVSSRLDTAIARATARAREDEKRDEEGDIQMAETEAMEMYLDSENDDSETE